MTIRRIKITGKNPPSAPGDSPTDKGKRKSPRCHIVVAHYREKKYIESYRRPRGCAFVPQLPKLPLPRTKVKLPPPPPLPQPPTTPRVGPKTLRDWQEFLDLLKAFQGKRAKGNYKHLLGSELYDLVVKTGQKLGFLDAFGFKSNAEIVAELVAKARAANMAAMPKWKRKVIVGNPEGVFNLTEDEIVALLRRGIIRKKGDIALFRRVRDHHGTHPLSGLVENLNKRGAPKPSELQNLIEDAIKQAKKDKFTYAKELEEWTKQSLKWTDEAADMLKDFAKATQDVAQKASKVKLGNRIATGFFAALDAVIGLVEGEDPLRAIGGAEAAVAGEMAGAAACVAAGLPSGGIGTAICGAVASFAAGYAFDRIDETGVIRNIPKNIKNAAKQVGEAIKNLRPSPPPQPKPKPTPTPVPIRVPDPTPTPSPSPKPDKGKGKRPKSKKEQEAKPSPYPGIQIVGTDRNGKPKYVTGNPDAPTAIWVRTKKGGYWRAIGVGEKPTINPDTGKPIDADDRSPNPTPTPAQKPKPSPYPGITIVGTDKKGRPKYRAGDYTWVRTKRGGYWRGEGNNKPTINPDTGKPLATPSPTPTPSPSSRPPAPTPAPTPKPIPPAPGASPTPSPGGDGGTIPPNIIQPNIVPPNISGAPPPSNQGSDRTPSNDRSSDRRPTHPDFTCVIRKDGTGYWRRKKGTPKDAPKPAIPCQPL